MGERVFGGELKDVASQLPREIAYYVTRAAVAQKLSLDDFYGRVAAREPADDPAARFHARAVISVLQDAISAGEIKDLRAQLPASYDELFDNSEFSEESYASSLARGQK